MVGDALGARATQVQPWGDGVGVEVEKQDLVEVCRRLKAEPRLAFTYFSFVTAVDRGDHFEVLYFLRSMTLGRHARVRTRIGRDGEKVPTLTGVFAGADWHERETCDMFGIEFEGHPDLRPILLAEGFEGHPLRKDYDVFVRQRGHDWLRPEVHTIGAAEEAAET